MTRRSTTPTTPRTTMLRPHRHNTQPAHQHHTGKNAFHSHSVRLYQLDAAIPPSDAPILNPCYS